MINLLLFNHFYRRVQKESDELLYTVWSLVMVREPYIYNQLPAQEAKSEVCIIKSTLSHYKRLTRFGKNVGFSFFTGLNSQAFNRLIFNV